MVNDDGNGDGFCDAAIVIHDLCGCGGHVIGWDDQQSGGAVGCCEL